MELKLNKPFAGYHLLMILSAVDGEFFAKEDLVIKKWIEKEMPLHVNLDPEIEILSALKKEDQAQILAEPNISVLDNQKAFILIGQRLNFPTLVGYTQANTPIFSPKTFPEEFFALIFLTLFVDSILNKIYSFR